MAKGEWNRAAMTDGSRGIHPTDRRVKMEMRRIATLETGTATHPSPVADATPAMLCIACPWLESHGYHHASAPRGVNWNRVAIDRR
jgi:hypothetical protein